MTFIASVLTQVTWFLKASTATDNISREPSRAAPGRAIDPVAESAGGLSAPTDGACRIAAQIAWSITKDVGTPSVFPIRNRETPRS